MKKQRRNKLAGSTLVQVVGTVCDGIWSATKPEPEQEEPCMVCSNDHGGRICPSVL